MFQIDNSTAVSAIPAPTPAGPPGYFTDGNPATGAPASIVPAEFMNMLMMEFINLIKEAGIAPSKSDYTQLSQAIPALISKLATVDWSKVTNIPADLVHANTVPTLGGVGLYSSTPYVDFHYGNDSSAYNVRLINSDDSTLSFLTKASGQIFSVGPSIISAAVQILAKSAISICSQGPNASLAFYNKDASKIEYFFQSDDTSLNLYAWSDSGSGVASLSITRSTGATGFSSRPSFAGATPWDSLNFNPATKANAATTVAGYGITDAVKVGDFGIGAGAAPIADIDNIGLPGGFYGTGTNTTSPMQYASVLNLPYQDNHYSAQLGFSQGTTVPHIWARSVSSPGVWSPSVEVLHAQSPTFVNISTVANAAYASVLATTGMVVFFATQVPPAGFIKANGAAISRTAYAGLFAIFSTYFGSGDGSTTFNVPDLRGEFIRGYDDARGVDINRVFGTWQAQDIQPHTHAVWSLAGVGSGGNNVNAGVSAGNTGPNTGSTGGTETRPRNFALLACIKY